MTSPPLEVRDLLDEYPELSDFRTLHLQLWNADPESQSDDLWNELEYVAAHEVNLIRLLDRLPPEEAGAEAERLEREARNPRFEHPGIRND